MAYAVDIEEKDLSVLVELVRYTPLPVPDGEPRRLRDQTIDQVHVGPPNWWERWRGITWEEKVERVRGRLQQRACTLTAQEEIAAAVAAAVRVRPTRSGVVPLRPWPPPPAPPLPRTTSEADPTGGRGRQRHVGVGVNPDPTTPRPSERGE